MSGPDERWPTASSVSTNPAEFNPEPMAKERV
jgi:hypothetical protein